MILNMITKNKQRLNIMLPQKTIKLLNSVSKKGNRSLLIDEAVNFFVKEKSKADLRDLLREGAIKRSDRDLKLAREWSALED